MVLHNFSFVKKIERTHCGGLVIRGFQDRLCICPHTHYVQGRGTDLAGLAYQIGLVPGQHSLTEHSEFELKLWNVNWRPTSCECLDGDWALSNQSNTAVYLPLLAREDQSTPRAVRTKVASSAPQFQTAKVMVPYALVGITGVRLNYGTESRDFKDDLLAIIKFKG